MKLKLLTAVAALTACSTAYGEIEELHNDVQAMGSCTYAYGAVGMKEQSSYLEEAAKREASKVSDPSEAYDLGYSYGAGYYMNMWLEEAVVGGQSKTAKRKYNADMLFDCDKYLPAHLQ